MRWKQELIFIILCRRGERRALIQWLPCATIEKKK